MISTAKNNQLIRNDYRIIIDLVESGSRVLDLGCGDGRLLELLQEEKQIVGYGVDISSDHIVQCVSKGLSVFQGDIDEGLRDFDDQSFDYVILNQTLPVVHRPAYVVKEMLRVGARGIVSFPNFAHWRIRLQLLFSGCMPVNETMPFEWYETPNIHHLTIKDFRRFCAKFMFTILDSHYYELGTNTGESRVRRNANWYAPAAVFVVARPPGTKERDEWAESNGWG